MAVGATWVLLGLTACGGGDAGGGTTSAPVPQTLAVAAGKSIFFAVSLSASGKQSCGTCHVPSRAFTGDPATDHGLPVPVGGPNLDQTGFRNASSLPAQAQQPFLTPFEMANTDAAEVLSRLQNSPATTG